MLARFSSAINTNLFSKRQVNLIIEIIGNVIKLDYKNIEKNLGELIASFTMEEGETEKLITNTHLLWNLLSFATIYDSFREKS